MPDELDGGCRRRGRVKPGTTAADNADLREARKRIRLLELETKALRRSAAYLSRRTCREMIYPLVRYSSTEFQ